MTKPITSVGIMQLRDKGTYVGVITVITRFGLGLGIGLGLGLFLDAISLIVSHASHLFADGAAGCTMLDVWNSLLAADCPNNHQ